MKDINGLCRICSGRGEFDIFQPIPIFLHENFTEHLKWKQNMSELIEQITGLVIAKGDGLPQNICEICISYLKHASIFRQQTIDNTHSLLKVLTISSENEFTSQHNLKKINNANTMHNKEAEIFFKNKKSLNVNFVNNLNSKTFYKSVKNLKIEPNFNAVEFQEDDILEDLKDTGILIQMNADELHKERKCKYCKRRYMFQDSFDEHIEECVEKKLTILIFKINYFLELKNRKHTTANQFIQNMILVLKENLEIVLKYSKDLVIPNLIPLNNENCMEPQNSYQLNNVIDTFQLPQNVKFKNIEPLEFSDSSNPSTPTIISSQVATASVIIPKIRCTPCQITFETLQLLEHHNFKYHNTIVPESTCNIISNRSLIALFERQDGFIDVPILDIFPTIINKSNKNITCSKCEAKFFTNAHLDVHVLKKHNK